MAKKKTIKKPSVTETLLTHKWHEGEIVYTILRTSWFCIPKCVARLKVTKVTYSKNEIRVRARHCNKKNCKDSYIERSFIIYRNLGWLSESASSLNIYLTKKEANEHFEAIKDEFISEYRDYKYKSMLHELNELDRKKNIIFGLMRMNIMKS